MIDAILSLDADVAAARIGNRVAFAECMGEGSTVMEAAPAARARRKSTRSRARSVSA